MRNARSTWRRAVLAAAGLCVLCGGAVLAAPLKRLPPDYVFPQAAKSPGKVAFRHSTHVDPKRPDCTRCHPRYFKILAKGKPSAPAAFKHKVMEKGKLCGACHNDKDAFGLTTECDMCHQIG